MRAARTNRCRAPDSRHSSERLPAEILKEIGRILSNDGEFAALFAFTKASKTTYFCLESVFLRRLYFRSICPNFFEDSMIAQRPGNGSRFRFVRELMIDLPRKPGSFGIAMKELDSFFEKLLIFCGPFVEIITPEWGFHETGVEMDLVSRLCKKLKVLDTIVVGRALASVSALPATLEDITVSIQGQLADIRAREHLAAAKELKRLKVYFDVSFDNTLDLQEVPGFAEKITHMQTYGQVSGFQGLVNAKIVHAIVGRHNNNLEEIAKALPNPETQVMVLWKDQSTKSQEYLDALAAAIADRSVGFEFLGVDCRWWFEPLKAKCPNVSQRKHDAWWFSYV